MALFKFVPDYKLKKILNKINYTIITNVWNKKNDILCKK
jgi:hypothetical protein